MNIISMIVDRDCHVSTSHIQVIKHVITRLKNGYETYKAMSRKDRRIFMRACIKAHDDNIEEYRKIMHGF